MGEAKRRGSFEQRKAEGIERQRLEAIEREHQKQERERIRAERLKTENEERARKGLSPKRRRPSTALIAMTLGFIAASTYLTADETRDRRQGDE